MEVTNDTLAMTSSPAAAKNNSTTKTIPFSEDLYHMYMENRSIHEPWFSTSIIFYSVVGGLGFLANVLITMSVIRKIRRPGTGWKREQEVCRDSLVLFLSLSDIMFLMTVPLTVIDGMSKYWPLSNSDFACKIVKSSSAIPVYCTSMILMVIAVERYRSIVWAAKTRLTPFKMIVIFVVIILLAISFTYPIFKHTHLIFPFSHLKDEGVVFAVNQTNDSGELLSISSEELSKFSFCIENWNDHNMTIAESDPTNRLSYSVFVITFQLGIPFTFISLVYLRIYCFLKEHRMSNLNERSRKLSSKTNMMLFAQSMIFCFCWLPLNTFSIVMDAGVDIFNMNSNHSLVAFIGFHILGMTITLFHPLMYGYWNDGFKRELCEIIKAMACGPDFWMNMVDCLCQSEEGKGVEMEMQELANNGHRTASSVVLVPRRPEDNQATVNSSVSSHKDVVVHMDQDGSVKLLLQEVGLKETPQFFEKDRVRPKSDSDLDRSFDMLRLMYKEPNGTQMPRLAEIGSLKKSVSAEILAIPDDEDTKRSVTSLDTPSLCYSSGFSCCDTCSACETSIKLEEEDRGSKTNHPLCHCNVNTH